MKLDLKDFYRILSYYILLNLLVLGISFIGFLIPFGAALTASYNVSFKLLDTKRQTYVVKDFFSSFKKNFIPATLYYLIIVLLLTGLFFMHNYAVNTDSTILRISVYIAVFEIVIVSNYFFAVLAIFKGDFTTLIKNSMLLAHTQFLTTLKMLGTNAFMLLLFFKVHSMTLLIMIALYVFLNAFHLRKLFDLLINKTVGEKDELY